jgi:hypothetical protein
MTGPGTRGSAFDTLLERVLPERIDSDMKLLNAATDDARRFAYTSELQFKIAIRGEP